MSEKQKVKPLTPGMKMLLEGGGATSFYQKRVPLLVKTAPKLGNAGETEPKILGANLVEAKNIPVLGQPQPAAETPPADQAAPASSCPGPVALPDGRILEPDDYIRLADLCEIMPYLLKAMAAAQKGPGMQVRVAGGIPGVQGVPTPGMFAGLGPLGPYAQGAAGGGFGGVGGGGAGPRGPAGPVGPPGADGSALILSDIAAGINKTDGDFTVAAGAFVVVPGTTVTFTMAEAGPVLVLIQATLTWTAAGGSSMNAALGVRIDGTDYSISHRAITLLAGGTAEWIVGQPLIYWSTLTTGNHTLDLILRGLTAFELGGLGTPAGIAANATMPLQIVVLHG